MGKNEISEVRTCVHVHFSFKHYKLTIRLQIKMVVNDNEKYSVSIL